jgi:hypothetical protein
VRVLGSLLLVFCCSAFGRSQDVPTPERAFHSYEAYLKSIRNLSFHSHFRDRVAEKSDVFTNALSQEWKIDLEGKRLRVTTRRASTDSKTDSGEAWVKQYNEALVTPLATHEISVDADGATVTGFISYIETPNNYWETKTGFGYLSYPFGYFQDGREYRYIPDMIEGASKSVASENEEGSSLVVLTCETEEYEFHIRLDPAKGWMADRIEFARGAPTGEAARPDYYLYTVERASDQGGVWLPDLYHCRVSRPAGRHKLPKNVRIVDGKYIIVAGSAEMGADTVEKPKSTLIAEVTLSDVDLSPLRDSDFQLQTNIPDGTRVSMQDAHHLEFIWRDGKIVPVTAESLEALRDSKFLGGAGSSRFWLVMSTLFLLALVLCLSIRHRWKTR